MQRAPREVLGVDRRATRDEIVSAYRRLAMRWHPDRNSSPGAKERFQEIQRAYRILQAEPPPQAAAPEETAADAKPAPQTNESAPEKDENVPRGDFPFAAAALAAGGALSFSLAEYPGDWVLLSLFLLAADAAYKTGASRRALRAEMFFRFALRLYWLALLAAAVWALWREVVSAA